MWYIVVLCSENRVVLSNRALRSQSKVLLQHPCRNFVSPHPWHGVVYKFYNGLYTKIAQNDSE